MRFEDLETLSTRRPDCPSELQLLRLAQDPAYDGKQEALGEHVTRCSECTATLAELRQGFAAMPEYHSEAALRKLQVHLKAQQQPSQRAIRRWSMRWALGIPLAMVAGALLWLQPASPPVSRAPGVTRSKGGLRLAVIQQTVTGSEELASGAVVQPDAILRFRIGLPRAGRVTILGYEADGTLYRAWPIPGASASRSVQAGEQLLPGAVQLDGQLGQERLYLVRCDDDVEPVCSSMGADQPPRCPTGCASVGFSLHKRLP